MTSYQFQVSTRFFSLSNLPTTSVNDFSFSFYLCEQSFISFGKKNIYLTNKQNNNFGDAIIFQFVTYYFQGDKLSYINFIPCGIFKQVSET